MKTVLILHGIGNNSKGNWFQWLKKELESHGFTVLLPDLPNSNHPNREEWLQIIKDLLQNVPHSELIIVGHSLGVTSALDYIEQSNKKIYGLVSISGFSDSYGSKLNDYFMKLKQIVFGEVLVKLGNAVVIYSDDDPYVPQQILRKLAEYLNVKPIIIEKGGHFNSESGYNEFPVLLNIIINL